MRKSPPPRIDTPVSRPLRAGAAVRPAPAQPPPAAAPIPEPRRSFIQRVGAAVVLFQLFAVRSRLPDQLALFLGMATPIVKVASLAALGCVLLGGGIKRALTAPPGIYLTLFTGWLILSTPFSVWKGGSVELLTDYWLKSYLFYIFTAGLIVTLRDCQRAVYSIALGGMAIAFLSFFVSAPKDGRLSLQAGVLENPNALAAFLIMGMPACLLLILNHARLSFWGLTGIAGMVLLPLTALKTGSRMGLLMLAGIGFIAFFKSPLKIKVGLAVLALVLVAVAPRFVSPEALVRYKALFTEVGSEELTRETANEMSRASGSTENRTELLKESIVLTLKHPLLGVGPGMFGTAAAGDSEDRRADVAYRQTHNGYTQLSSEAGLPALALMLATGVYCFRNTRRVYLNFRGRPGQERLANTAYCLHLWLLLVAILNMFGNDGYDSTVPVLAGLTLAISEGAARAAAASAAPLPEPAAVRPRPAPLRERAANRLARTLLRKRKPPAA